jgi:hypothetical protein
LSASARSVSFTAARLVCVKYEAFPRKVITIFGVTPLSINCLGSAGLAV